MSIGFASNSSLRSARRGSALATSTSSDVGVVRVDGTTMLVDATGTISVNQTSLNTLSSNTWRSATSSIQGLVRPDGTSILITSGVISVATVQTDGTSISSVAGILKIATSSNGFGVRTVSTSAPSGGNHGDIWYQV